MSKATVAEPPSNANEGPAEPPARQSKPPPDPRAATIKAPTNRLARQSPNDNHARAAMPVSHPDRRCLPIQIAALQRRLFDGEVATGVLAHLGEVHRFHRGFLSGALLAPGATSPLNCCGGGW